MASLKSARPYVLYRFKPSTVRSVSNTTSRPPLQRTQNEHINRRLQGIEDGLTANPFTNILCTALRRDATSTKVVPRGMLLQLKSVYLPPEQSGPEDRSAAENSETNINSMQIDLLAIRRNTNYSRPQKEVILPSNLLHPSFQAEKPGRSMYITLSKSALDSLVTKGRFDVLKRFSKTSTVPTRLTEIVESQLRERVVQEVRLLVKDAGAGDVNEHDEMRCFVVALDLDVRRRLREQGVLERYIFMGTELFQDEGQREDIVDSLRKIRGVQTCTRAVSDRLGLQSTDHILCIPFTVAFAPLNVALWRVRCFFGQEAAVEQPFDQ